MKAEQYDKTSIDPKKFKLINKGLVVNIAKTILVTNDQLPVKTDQPVHSGKVRSVYWLNKQDSQRLAEQREYDVADDADLAIMVISDRISAFDCRWKAENNLHGVPLKGAALNSISAFWFELFQQQGLAENHILEIPHPLVWIVQKARPVKIEAIARQYITGSMWRAYAKGERLFCGIALPEDLKKNQRLDELLNTPSTKGIMHGIPGVPAVDDCSISRDTIEAHYQAFDFRSVQDITVYENLLQEGFDVISKKLQSIGQVLVDTKFEFGYVTDKQGKEKLIYMDEVGTPDSSRFWNESDYNDGNIVELSKESFRQALLSHVPEPDILLNSDRMSERLALAENMTLPESVFMDVSAIYKQLSEQITGKPLPEISNPQEEIIETLHSKYNLIA